MGHTIIYYEDMVTACDDPPMITLNPVDQATSAGVQVCFDADSTGGCPPVTCRWQELVNGVWVDIVGETSTQLCVTPSATPTIGPVTNLSCITVTDDSVTANWSPPTNTGSSPITGYDVEYRVQGTVTWTTSSTSATPPHTITGLAANTTYEVRVRAKNGVEPDGPYTTTLCTTTGATLAPVYVDAFSEYSGNNVNTPNTVNVTPGTIQVGDLLLFSDTADGPSSANAVKTWVTPTGATQLAGFPDPGVGFAPAQNWWFKIATAADAAATSYTFGCDNANQHSSFVHVIRNATTATAGNNIIDSGFTNSTITIPADTMPANSIYVSMLGVQRNTPTITQPAGMTESGDVSPGWHSGAVAYEDYPTGGSTGPTTWTIVGDVSAMSASSVIVS